MSQHRGFARLAGTMTATLSLLAACGSDSTAPATPTTISAVAGANAQVGTVGQALANNISVTVLSASGTPVPGVFVSWAVQSGGGTISVTSSSTDSLGVASVSWTLGTVAGADTLVATVGSLTPLVFSATANPGDVASLVKVSGDAQVVAAGTTAAPFIVKAEDTYGNAVPGVTVTWVTENGGELSTTTTVTGADGLAQNVFTVDTTTTYDVMAELPSNPTVETVFTATGT
jgi:adhesin/invasin